MISLEKRERIRANLKKFAESSPAEIGIRGLLVSAIDDIVDEVVLLEDAKVSNSDLKLVIQGMETGFKQMDERFEAMQKQMDVRFEAVDKRFEDMNQRFTSQQWLIGIGFTSMALLITLFSYLKPPITPEMLERAVQSGMEKSVLKPK